MTLEFLSPNSELTQFQAEPRQVLRAAWKRRNLCSLCQPVHCFLWHTDCGTLWHTVAHCGTLWHTVAHCGTLWHTVAYCGILWAQGPGSWRQGPQVLHLLLGRSHVKGHIVELSLWSAELSLRPGRCTALPHTFPDIACEFWIGGRPHASSCPSATCPTLRWKLKRLGGILRFQQTPGFGGGFWSKARSSAQGRYHEREP